MYPPKVCCCCPRAFWLNCGREKERTSFLSLFRSFVSLCGGGGGCLSVCVCIFVNRGRLQYTHFPSVSQSSVLSCAVLLFTSPELRALFSRRRGRQSVCHCRHQHNSSHQHVTEHCCGVIFSLSLFSSTKLCGFLGSLTTMVSPPQPLLPFSPFSTPLSPLYF